MQEPDSDATQIKTNGWRQGSVLPDPFVQHLTEKSILTPSEHARKFIIASHDCDVTNRSFAAEPAVELLSAEVLPASKKDGNYFWGRNPRYYQLERKGAGATTVWQFSIQERLWLPRRHLLDSEPDAALAMPPDDIRRLALWLARRYHRVAFPDEFVDRTKGATQKLRRPLKKHGDLLTAVFLLGVDEDLPPETPYEILIYGPMRAEDWSDPEQRASAQVLLNKVEAAFGQSPGVEVTQSVLCSEADISLDDRRRLRHWDFDDLTIQGEGPAALPPAD